MLLFCFLIGEKIGDGATAVVFKALSETGQFVAIKRFYTQGLSGTELQSIMKEASIMTKLNHDNIIKIIGYHDAPPYFYLFLEYAEGGSLMQLLREFQALPEFIVAMYMEQVLDALRHLHAEEVLHRDIKACNLMLTNKGQVKLIDFGISVSLEGKEKTYTTVGSPYWMAPEVICAENEGYGFPSDIWSVACTIVELLTGKPPFFEHNSITAAFKIIQTAQMPIPNFVSPDLASLLNLCFQKNPEMRPTAAALLSHPWFTCYKKSSPSGDDPSFLRRALQSSGPRPTIRRLSVHVGPQTVPLRDPQTVVQQMNTASTPPSKSGTVRGAVPRPRPALSMDSPPVKAPSTPTTVPSTPPNSQEDESQREKTRLRNLLLEMGSPDVPIQQSLKALSMDTLTCHALDTPPTLRVWSMTAVGSFVWIGGNDGSVFLWRGSRCEFFLRVHKTRVLALLPLKRALWVSSEEGEISIIDFKTLKTSRIAAHDDNHRVIKFLLPIKKNSKTKRIWSCAPASVSTQISIINKHGVPKGSTIIKNMVLSMDQIGTSVWLGCFSHLEKLNYKTADCEVPDIALGDPNSRGVNGSLAVGDHLLLATGNTVNVFATTEGGPKQMVNIIAHLPHKSPVTGMCLAQSHVITGDRDGKLYCWDPLKDYALIPTNTRLPVNGTFPKIIVFTQGPQGTTLWVSDSQNCVHVFVSTLQNS
ncbi:MAP3K epsilon protein kinase 1 [Pelomyxa schiedti]|nr:MAP3K epsilon protein kinase 1 [Pelomyxa schiedti]